MTSLDTIKTALLYIERYTPWVLNDIKIQDERIDKRRNDKLLYKGYNAPEMLISDDDLKLSIQAIQIAAAMNGTAYIPVHHPYYRHQLKELAKEKGLASKTIINYNYDFHDDSDLFYHYNCRKTYPASLVFWKIDRNFRGEFYQYYASCDRCRADADHDKMLSDYRNDTDSGFGYEYRHGKNCLVVCSEDKLKKSCNMVYRGVSRSKKKERR